jgi:hypothetical protein
VDEPVDHRRSSVSTTRVARLGIRFSVGSCLSDDQVRRRLLSFPVDVQPSDPDLTVAMVEWPEAAWSFSWSFPLA